MAVTPVAVTTTTMDGPYYGAGLLGIDTIYNFMLEPQVFGELVQLYGKGVGLHEILTFSGNTMDIASHDYQAMEELPVLNFITITTAIGAGGAGAHIDVIVADDANGETLLSPNDGVLIPGNYVNAGASTSPAKYQVTTSVDGGAGFWTHHCIPLLTTYQITAQVPINTTLMVTGGNYAPGVAGGNPKHGGWHHRHFFTAIKKAAFQLDGSIQSTARYMEKLKNGQSGMFTKASLEADFLLSSYISDELLVGVVPDNAIATQVNTNNVANVVYGTEGLWPALEARGMEQTYVLEYGASDLDDAVEGFESQGVLSKFATFCMGGELYRGFENSGLDFITQFSGGTDLMKNMGEMGIEFRRVKKNGVDFAIVKLDTFSNPLTYGLASYNWPKYGFIVPSEYVVVKEVGGSKTVELANLNLGYKNYNGENRRRVFGIQPGMTGMSPNGSIVSQWDATAGEFLSEFALIANKVNQMIKVII
jgi:hypothetical protein